MWTSTSISFREAAEIARGAGMADPVSIHEGRAEALPIDDATFDVAFSSTEVQRVNAYLMLLEIMRVTKPGGRVTVLGHAHDMNRCVNLPLGIGLKTRIEFLTWVDDRGHPQGCDHATLDRQFAQLNLTDLRMYPFVSTLSDPTRLRFMEGGILSTINAAGAQARADGALCISTPFHRSVGTNL